MEKEITLEGITYTLRQRNVLERKNLLNKVRGDGTKTGMLLGDLEVETVMLGLKAWSRPEPLTRENFENLTPGTHLEKLWDETEKINKLSEELKNA